MDIMWIFIAVFLASLAGLVYIRSARSGGELKSQFVVTGTLLLIFYIVCFCSGVCTILNFLFRWIF